LSCTKVYYNYKQDYREFPDDLFSQLIVIMQCGARNDNKKLVIVLDGLDEADEIFEPFFSTNFPHGVYIIVSARAAEDETLKPKYLEGWVNNNPERLALKQLTQEAIPYWLSQIPELESYSQDSDFVKKLDEITDGYPLHLSYLIDELKQTAKQNNPVKDALNDTPREFKKYVSKQIEQIPKQDKYWNLLVLLPITKAALKEEAVKEIMGWQGSDLMQLWESWQVTRWLRTEDALFSFAHPELAEVFKQEFERTLKDDVEKSFQNLLSYCAAWDKDETFYALRYYAEHLKDDSERLRKFRDEAKLPRNKEQYSNKLNEQLEKLYELARNEEFAEYQKAILNSEPELPLKVIKLALQSKAEADEAGGMAEFLLLHARRKIEITQESPLDALRTLNLERKRNLERAWKLAEQASREDCVLWHLLLAWALITQDDHEDDHELDPRESARETLERLQSMPSLLRLSDWKADCAVYLLGQILSVLQRDYQSLIQKFLPNNSYQALIKILTAIAIAQFESGDATAAQTTLNAALATAQQIEDSSSKAGALKEIAIAQANAKDAAAALTTAQQIEDSSSKAGALKDIAIAQVNAGDAAAALATAQQIEDSSSKAGALKEIAIAQVNAGDAAAALATAQLIEDSSDKAIALKDIAIAQAKAKLNEQAIATAEKILSDRNKHLLEIAATFAETDNKECFKQLLIPCAEYLNAAYAMCWLLANLYPQQATAIAENVSSVGEGDR
jgi:hypothetical protein